MFMEDLAQDSDRGATRITDVSSSPPLSLAAEHLTAALRRPQPRREAKWVGHLHAELGVLRQMVDAHRHSLEAEDGLYGELRVEAPRLLPRVEQLVHQVQEIDRLAAELLADADHVSEGDTHRISAIQGEARSMLTMIRSTTEAESALLYESLNDPAAMD